MTVQWKKLLTNLFSISLSSIEMSLKLTPNFRTVVPNASMSSTRLDRALLKENFKNLLIIHNSFEYMLIVITNQTSHRCLCFCINIIVVSLAKHREQKPRCTE